LRKLAEARTKIEARAKERYARELAEHEAKLAARAAKTGNFASHQAIRDHRALERTHASNGHG
jgi:hypothetical protein